VLEVQGTESGISIYAITGGKMAESKSNRIDTSLACQQESIC
jgi:hypothetical protein